MHRPSRNEGTQSQLSLFKASTYVAKIIEGDMSLSVQKLEPSFLGAGTQCTQSGDANFEKRVSQRAWDEKGSAKAVFEESKIISVMWRSF